MDPEMNVTESVDEMKAAVLDKATAIDEQTDEMYGQIMPPGTYSKRSMKTLIDSLSKVNVLFDAPPISLPATEIQDDVLPAELVKNIKMIVDAATEYGMEADAFDLSTVVDDTGLDMLSGVFSQLAKDKMFKKFLAEPKPEVEAGESAVAVESEQTPVGIDELILSRV